MMAIAGATLLPPACCKVEREKREPHHNTTYVWGDNNWDAVWPADKVAASADSVLVDNVFLLNDGKSLSGLDVTRTRQNMELIINSVSKQNQYKIRGAGNLRHLNINDKNDSIWLANFGFKIVEANHYKQM